MWTPEGSRLIFSSDRVGTRNLFWQPVNGSGAAERIGDSSNRQSATAVSPDGRHVIVTETSQTSSEDVMQVELSGRHLVTPLVQTPFIERNGVVSPNGRWLAYETNDAGRFEIWVQPYPVADSGRWQVSVDGGTRPLWARNGNELFYVSLAGALMRVAVQGGATWTAMSPMQLIAPGYLLAPPIDSGRSYDVSPDGHRFLMIKDRFGSTENAPSRSIIVVQHWAEELKKLAATR
jgi:serine/threonine-protein kinase